MPVKQDRSMHQKQIRPSGVAYERIDRNWPEVRFLDKFLTGLDK